VNAIQGFAELIQQQLFGPAPNEYRALAAAVAVDAARLLAGFDEIDRLARLETGAIAPESGEGDLREAAAQTLRRLETVLRQRSARIDLSVSGSPFTVALDPAELLQLVWRLLGTFAGLLAPGEIVEALLSGDGEQVVLEIDIPASLLGGDDPFTAAAPPQPRAISAGMFGTGFTLRLARAETIAAGGTLARSGDRLRLALPVLTGTDANHTTGREDGGTGAAA
jgi:two-component system OmpR family sensor kinase